MIWIALNAVSAAVVLICCICRLSTKQFVSHSPFVWAYALVGASCMVVLLFAARGQVPHMSEVAANVGMMIYFMARSHSLRLWRKHLGRK